MLDTGEDGRVIAVLGNKIDNLTNQVEGLSDNVADYTEKSNERLRHLEKGQAVQGKEIDTIGKDVEALKTKSNLYDFLNGAVALVAAGIAAAIGWNR